MIPWPNSSRQLRTLPIQHITPSRHKTIWSCSLTTLSTGAASQWYKPHTTWYLLHCKRVDGLTRWCWWVAAVIPSNHQPWSKRNSKNCAACCCWNCTVRRGTFSNSALTRVIRTQAWAASMTKEWKQVCATTLGGSILISRANSCHTKRRNWTKSKRITLRIWFV